MCSRSLVMLSLFNTVTNTIEKQRITRSGCIRGFGLVELMVSVSIMVLLSGVILARHSAFNGAVLLRNQAYEVAFALRQAQLLAVSGINKTSTSVSTLKVQQYGVHFNETSGQNTSYFIFHDNDVDGQYDSLVDDVVETFQIDKRFDIRSITGSGNIVDVTFRRPNFDAIFTPDVSRTVSIDIAKVNSLNADINTGTVRRVQVTKAGNISVTKY